MVAEEDAFYNGRLVDTPQPVLEQPSAQCLRSPADLSSEKGRTPFFWPLSKQRLCNLGQCSSVAASLPCQSLILAALLPSQKLIPNNAFRSSTLPPYMSFVKHKRSGTALKYLDNPRVWVHRLETVHSFQVTGATHLSSSWRTELAHRAFRLAQHSHILWFVFKVKEVNTPNALFSPMVS